MTDSTLSILKKAILLERRGKAFYTHVSKQTQEPSLRDFFEAMAEEEDRHEAILARQFRAVRTTGRFEANEGELPAETLAVSQVLTPDVAVRLASAGFEASAVSASMAMEANAIAMYRQAALDAVDPEEKNLYGWLADFETGHYETLAKLDRVLTESAWNDAAFWPF